MKEIVMRFFLLLPFGLVLSGCQTARPPVEDQTGLLVSVTNQLAALNGANQQLHAGADKQWDMLNSATNQIQGVSRSIADLQTRLEAQHQTLGSISNHLTMVTTDVQQETVEFSRQFGALTKQAQATSSSITSLEAKTETEHQAIVAVSNRLSDVATAIQVMDRRTGEQAKTLSGMGQNIGQFTNRTDISTKSANDICPILKKTLAFEFVLFFLALCAFAACLIYVWHKRLQLQPVLTVLKPPHEQFPIEWKDHLKDYVGLIQNEQIAHIEESKQAYLAQRTRTICVCVLLAVVFLALIGAHLFSIHTVFKTIRSSQPSGCCISVQTNSAPYGDTFNFTAISGRDPR